RRCRFLVLSIPHCAKFQRPAKRPKAHYPQAFPTPSYSEITHSIPGRPDILIKTPPRKKARIPRKISGKKVKKKVSKRNPDFVLRQHRDDCVLCEPASDFKIANWQRERLDELVEAHEAAPQGWERPHIICFGELAYPPPPAAVFAAGVDYVKQFGRYQVEFEQDVRKTLHSFSSATRPFLFLGSYHCPITLYNVGMIMPRGGQEVIDMRVVSRVLTRDGFVTTTKDEEIRAPIPHRKRFPAKRDSEQTRVPPDNAFRVFATPVGRVAVLICSDIIDLNQFLLVARYNDSAGKMDRIDFVLVPSHNTSPKLLQMCQQLSWLAVTTVIIVNANGGANSAYPETTVYCCGKSLMIKGEKKSRLLEVVSKSLIHSGKGIRRHSKITWFRFRSQQLADLINDTTDLVKSRLGLATNLKAGTIYRN
ncbi:MAG: hypothetical protein NTV97_09825, partial [Alphaproteobacteria bacterium]|nr:hypothetical protein [Alphaproteobacteria bacterium]